MEYTKLLTLLKQCLCPPGEGVFTVKTAETYKQSLQKKLYGGAQDTRLSWEASLKKLDNNHSPVIMGISSDCGGGILRGANWGPLFIREKIYQMYPDIDCFELGDVRVIPQLLLDDYLNTATLVSCKTALYNNPNSHYPVSPLSIAELVATQFNLTFPDKKLLTFGGDHSISYPMVKAFLKHATTKGIKAGLLHFDAHTDLLESRLGIDICFGSWTYHILKYLPQPEALCQVGIRATGHSKQHWEEKYQIKQVWAKDVKDHGKETIANQIITHYQALGIEALYITFDIDCIDASQVSATGTPEPSGLLKEETIYLITECAKHFSVLGADIAEVAPFSNPNPEYQSNEPNSTLSIAAEIANTLLQTMRSKHE